METFYLLRIFNSIRFIEKSVVELMEQENLKLSIRGRVDAGNTNQTFTDIVNSQYETFYTGTYKTLPIPDTHSFE